MYRNHLQGDLQQAESASSCTCQPRSHAISDIHSMPQALAPRFRNMVTHKRISSYTRLMTGRDDLRLAAPHLVSFYLTSCHIMLSIMYLL